MQTYDFHVYEGDIRLLHPEIPEGLTGDNFPVPSGFARVMPTDPPDIDLNLKIWVETMPKCIDGVWHRDFDVRDLTPEELTFRMNQPSQITTGTN